MFSKDPRAPVYYFGDVGNFFSFVAEIIEAWGEVWFRGHRNGGTPLEPRIIRDLSYLSQEHAICRDFVRRATGYFQSLDPRNYSRWLFLMQHYGIPTRLLDWTESLPVALYFAFEREETSPPCIWLLNPISLNDLSIGEAAIPHEDAKEAQDYCRAAFSLVGEHRTKIGDLPLCVLPHYFDQRLVAQRACFTVHGRKPMPMDALLMEAVPEKSESILAKAQFVSSKIPEIRRQIANLVPGRAQLFPDVEGLVGELKDIFLHSPPKPIAETIVVPPSVGPLLSSARKTRR